MKTKKLNATTLRLILGVSLFAIAALAIVGFSYAKTYLEGVAVDTSHIVVDASASQDSLQTLQKVQKELESNKDVIARTQSIVAESQSYQYQDQIINDLNTYAAQAGLSITNLDFATTSGASAAPTPAPGAAAAVPAAGGLKSTSVTVTLSSPVDYTKLLSFIQSVEQNLTKMQISRVSLSKGADSGTVTSDALAIEVYIK